ncbi:MAG TPA: DUF2961 domain-containing protein [Armatimonadetes bacterium]|nr:DUF2961 domain-containing protein [Armatimonadota bacterium]
MGLRALPLVTDAETRSISPENPTGEKGGGAKEPPSPESPARRLGKGWKVRPCITLRSGERTTLADIEGPGIIQHIWITVSEKALRDCVIRFYWDGEESPSIEAPLGDFFLNGHGLRYTVHSLATCVNPSGGMNCYLPMPFRKRAKVEVENQRWEDIPGFFYQITYALTEIPKDAGYLHAQWRRSVTSRERPEHAILDGVRGKGHYIGTALYWTQLSSGWRGEGEVKFFIDSDTESPTICGTGTEDYFGGAWGFGSSFCSPYTGYIFHPPSAEISGTVPKHSMYRWHILDPIRFRSSLKVTIQALGWWPDGTFQPLTDDVSSVAYWYQMEPHAPFPPLPSLEERWPR